MKITGEEHLFSGSALVLPNHVALIDPQIVLAFLSKYKKLHPLAENTYYKNPILKPLFKAIGAIGIDNAPGSMSREEIDSTTTTIVDQLHKGKSIVVYPSGQLKTQGREVIIGKKIAYEVLDQLPDNTRVLLVRIL